MRQLIQLSLFVFTLISITNSFGQLIWEENFDVPGKGYWADSLGIIQSDLTNINWSTDISGCTFSDENDYAKTVSTAGGRFEVIDSDGEVTWMSAIINISNFDAISISLDASETGSSNVDDKKYIKAFYKIDNQEPFPFQPESTASGNWGIKAFVQNGISGADLQIIIKMNSSYANDKVIIDNIQIQAIDSSSIAPSLIKIIESPLIAFLNDTVLLSAAVFNEMGEMINDSAIHLTIESNSLTIIDSFFEDGLYQLKLTSDSIGTIPFSIYTELYEISRIDSSITFYSEESIIIREYFENEIDPNWNVNADWEISSEFPITGSYSVKHVEKEEGGTSALIYNGEAVALNTSDHIFSFQLKNGDWDPSSSNSFYFWMTSIGNNEFPDGYAVGVNAEGSTDLVSFWKIHNGQAAILLSETAFNWEPDQKAQFNIQRKVKGEWSIIVTNLNNGESYSCNTIDNEFLIIDELQLIFNYTSSRSGELWFDNIIVLSQNTAPFISNLKATDRNEIQVSFNEAIQMDLIASSNFTIEGKSGKQYTILDIDKISSTELIITTEEIDEPYLKIIAYSIHDLEDQISLIDELDFEYTLTAELYDIVFTELMVDPNPTIGLPEAEYIEVYNRSNKNIQLNGWSIIVRDKVLLLPELIIQPEEYIILCDDEFAADFLYYGKVLQIEKFPSLLNSGTSIELKSENDRTIEKINYSDEWYFDDLKDNGGYSLERIDYNRFCGQYDNWAASENIIGGTPGMVNSIDAINTDLRGPEIIAIDVVSVNAIAIIFNEPLDSISARNTSNFFINGIIINKIEYSPNELELFLKLGTNLKSNTEYQLELSEIQDECGNSLNNSSATFVLTDLHKGDVLINEVLFNPLTDGADFVELYNNSGVNIDLNDLLLASRDDSLKLKTVYNISEHHSIFSNKTFIALSKDTNNIMGNYYVVSSENLIQMAKFPSYNNDEGRVVVLNDSLAVIDEFLYNENMHSEWLNDSEGVSLERISIKQETNLQTNWHSASSIVGYATPGCENSQANFNEAQKNLILLESDIVSPNGDGYNDELIISFKVDQPGYLYNVYIFNANGNLIKRISNNDLIGNNNKITYDLRDQNGSLIPMGTYFILSEQIHPSSKKIILKKAFHVTDVID